MSYKQIKSQFIKDKIKGLEWNEDNRNYIDDLMSIEEFALGKSYMCGAIVRDKLRKKYSKEFKAIYNELSPKLLESIDEREEKEEEKKLSEEKKEKTEQDKKEWLEMGGR